MTKYLETIKSMKSFADVANDFPIHSPGGLRHPEDY